MDSTQELRNLIAEHTVRYEIWPHYDVDDGAKVIDGFDLELHGTHEHGHSRLTPGCDLCRQTYEHLRHIAEAVLPREERPSEYEIPPFDNSLHGKRGGEMEVVLTICIRHRNQYFATVDECEEKCLREMRDKLTGLGVARGGGTRRWS